MDALVASGVPKERICYFDFEDDRLSPVTPETGDRVLETFRYLYPEVTVHQWHRPWVEEASSMLLDLISHVPVWLLECRPDQGAVRLLKETIMERQKEGD